MFFLTGGTGFIGKYVIKKLLECDEKIIVLVRNKQSYTVQGDEIVIEGNLESYCKWMPHLKKFPVNTCIHLAWEGIPDYSYEMSKRNLLYGLAVLDICKETKIRNLIMTGSCWEYDNPNGSVSVNCPISSSNAFKAAKNALHMMAHTFCLENHIYFNWLRLFYVYGPGQRSEALIPYAIRCLKQGKQLQLNGVYNRNDFVYVTDVADAIVKVANDHIYPETLNVGSGYSTQVLSIVNIIRENMGKMMDKEVSVGDEYGIDFYADKQEMYRDFSWEAKVPIENGVKSMIASIQI